MDWTVGWGQGGRLLALQPAIERNVAASRSNLDFYRALLACQAPRVSLRVHVSEPLHYLETAGHRALPLPCLFITVTECGLEDFQKEHKFTGTERALQGQGSILMCKPASSSSSSTFSTVPCALGIKTQKYD
jgi:hypothetical protein